MPGPVVVNPLPTPTANLTPRMVLAAKVVDLALVTYVDETGQQRTTLAVVGDNKVQMLNARDFGIAREPTPSGIASDWLAKGIFEKLKPSEKA